MEENPVQNNPAQNNLAQENLVQNNLNPSQAVPAPQPGVQPQPGAPQTLPQGYKVCEKNLFVWVFAFLLGGLGVDRFVRGQIGLGICKLLFNWITLGIWALVDWIIAMTKAYGAAFGRSKDLIFDNQGRYTA